MVLFQGWELKRPLKYSLEGIVDGSEVALSYALLGGFAALISYSGITDYFVEKIINKLKVENKKIREYTLK